MWNPIFNKLGEQEEMDSQLWLPCTTVDMIWWELGWTKQWDYTARWEMVAGGRSYWKTL